MKDLQLYETITLENLRDIFDIGYKRETYDDKIEYKVKDRVLEDQKILDCRLRRIYDLIKFLF